VRDRLILHAIHEAYRNILPSNVFPATLLFLEMPYDEVDVNVHPAKIEVRFRRSQFVHDFTRDSIRQALMTVRQSPVSPLRPLPPVHRKTQMQRAFPYRTLRQSIPQLRPSFPAPSFLRWKKIGLGSGVGSDGGFDLTGAPFQPVEQRFAFPPGAESSTEPGAAFGLPTQAGASTLDRPAPNWAANFAAGNGSAPATLPHPDQIADLKPLGQVSASFIVAVNGEGLWLVDQHVAHERVLFEQHLEARRAGKVESQRMLMPMILELAPRQLVIYEKIAEELSANGFRSRTNGPAQRSHPSRPRWHYRWRRRKTPHRNSRRHRARNAAISIETLQAKIAASTACHAAIKVNMPLDQTKWNGCSAPSPKPIAP